MLSLLGSYPGVKSCKKKVGVSFILRFINKTESTCCHTFGVYGVSKVVYALSFIHDVVQIVTGYSLCMDKIFEITA